MVQETGRLRQIIMDLFKRKKNKTELEKEAEDLYKVNEDSDLPISEKKTKQKKIRTVK